MLRLFAFAVVDFLLCASNASAIGLMTQINCANDYYAYCSEFQVGSKELRLCMRRVGPKLSKACLDALIADGEVSKSEVEKRKEAITAAKSPNKQNPTAEQKAVEAPQRLEAKALILYESTFAALKNREPRFVEEAEAAEAPLSGDEMKVPDPPKDSMVVADPRIGSNTKSEATREHERNAIDNEKARAKIVRAREAVRHAKSKNKIAAQKVEQHRKDETASR
jgi:hypothetical protein